MILIFLVPNHPTKVEIKTTATFGVINVSWKVKPTPGLEFFKIHYSVDGKAVQHSPKIPANQLQYDLTVADAKPGSKISLWVSSHSPTGLGLRSKVTKSITLPETPSKWTFDFGFFTLCVNFFPLNVAIPVK